MTENSETKIELLFKLFNENGICDELINKIIYEFNGLQTIEVPNLKILHRAKGYKPNYSCFRPYCYNLINLYNLFHKENYEYKLHKVRHLNKLEDIDFQVEKRNKNTDGWWYAKQSKESDDYISDLIDYEDGELELKTQNLIVLQELRWRLCDLVMYHNRRPYTLEPNYNRIIDLLETIGIKYITDLDYDDDNQIQPLLEFHKCIYKKQYNLPMVCLREKIDKFHNQYNLTRKYCNACCSYSVPFFVRICDNAFNAGEIRDLFDEEVQESKCLYCAYVEKNFIDHISKEDYWNIKDEILALESLEHMNRVSRYSWNIEDIDDLP